MKKGLILFISLVLALSLVGCGAKEKLGEKAVEKMIEGSSGAKVDIKGDKIKIKTEDGSEEYTFGDSEWPKNDFVKNIPAFKGGKIASVMTSEKYAMIVIEKVKEGSFTSYLDEIKKDYSESVIEMNADGISTYGAEHVAGNEINVLISYDKPRETLSIILSQAEEDE